MSLALVTIDARKPTAEGRFVFGLVTEPPDSLNSR